MIYTNKKQNMKQNFVILFLFLWLNLSKIDQKNGDFFHKNNITTNTHTTQIIKLPYINVWVIQCVCVRVSRIHFVWYKVPEKKKDIYIYIYEKQLKTNLS